MIDPELPCWLCGSTARPVLKIEHTGRVFLAACAVCMAQALETLTGYGFVKQLSQWQALTEYHAARREAGMKDTRLKRGERYLER